MLVAPILVPQKADIIQMAERIGQGMSDFRGDIEKTSSQIERLCALRLDQNQRLRNAQLLTRAAKMEDLVACGMGELFNILDLKDDGQRNKAQTSADDLDTEAHISGAAQAGKKDHDEGDSAI